MPGTEDGRYPFWSPDSRTLAFFAQGKLKRVNLDGSSAQVICDSPAGGWGGSWNTDDIIIAGVNDPGPIARVCAKGDCPPVPVSKVAPGDFDHDWPYFLPDGRHFIYTGWSDAIAGYGTIYLGSIDSNESKVLAKDVVQQAGFAGPDYLLVLRNDSLTAQKLDLRTFELLGNPLPIAPNALQPISASTTGASRIQPDRESRGVVSPGSTPTAETNEPWRAPAITPIHPSLPTDRNSRTGKRIR